MRFERRNIGLAIVFSIITCGIYTLYWFYVLMDELYRLNGEPSNAGLDLVFSIITCGIYGIYINYQMGKKIDYIRVRNGLHSKDNSVLFLVLSLFGLTLINYCIAQSELNDELYYLADRDPGRPGPGPYGN